MSYLFIFFLWGIFFYLLSFRGILSHFGQKLGLTIFFKEFYGVFFGNLNNLGAYLIKFPLYNVKRV